MKKFESLGRNLTIDEQKKIKGGLDDGGGNSCPSGETEYCCDYTLADETTGNEAICGTSTFDAKVKLKQKYPAIASSSCC